MKKELSLTLLIIFTLIFSITPIHAEVAHDSWPGIPVTEEDQVVDSITINGITVNAYYSPRVSGEYYKYQCTELVNRFYEKVYGIKNATWTNVKDKYFVEVTDPKPGDWQYSIGHSAIVKKKYKDNNGKVWVVTIDQNYWASSDNALWGRRVTLDESGITYYRYVGDKATIQVEGFVTRLYNLCLNRKPDAGGLAYWVNKLVNGTDTAAYVVKGFFESKEMINKNLNDTEFLEICYLAMMDRKSDASGRKYWLNILGSGMSRDFVLKGFIDSNEFNNICGDFGVKKGTLETTEPRDVNKGITSFVVRCYTKALGRKFDVNGLNYWVEIILASDNPRDAALYTASDGFFHSKEFQNKNVGDEEYVKVLYQTFLNREADKGGFNYWFSKLNNGMSRDEVMNGFAYSKEFENLMIKYGL